MNKDIHRLIIFKTWLLCGKVENEKIKYELIKTCLNHLFSDYELANNSIHINNLNRRKIMATLGTLFRNNILDKESYVICLDFVTDLFEYYEDLNYKNRTY